MFERITSIGVFGSLSSADTLECFINGEGEREISKCIMSFENLVFLRNVQYFCRAV